MYLIDTNVISELRKGAKADAGAAKFVRESENAIFLPVQVIGELRYGVERLKLKNDFAQARRLEKWLQFVVESFDRRILAFDLTCAEMWGTLMGINDQHSVDKQIAAVALVYDLTVVTRNTADFAGTGVRLINPFSADAPASA